MANWEQVFYIGWFQLDSFKDGISKDRTQSANPDQRQNSRKNIDQEKL